MKDFTHNPYDSFEDAVRAQNDATHSLIHEHVRKFDNAGYRAQLIGALMAQLNEIRALPEV